MAKPGGAPWWAHVMLYAGGLTMVAAGGTAAVAQYGVYTTNNTLEQEEILGDFQAEMDVENIEGPLNILVLGVDKQGGATRSDTMILVHINKDLSEAAMVSLPRDLYVDIPDCGPGYSNNPCTTKLNHAASISDDWEVTRANVVETIHDLTDLDFHIGATADFNGFVDMVELVGEIEICSWKTFQSHHTERVFEEGCHYYDQEAALDLVRQRYQFYDQIDYDKGLYGDYARQAFQQQAIKSLLTEARAQGFLKDPRKITDLLEGFGDKVTLQLPPGMEVIDLVASLKDLDPEAITSIRTPAHSEENEVGAVEVIGEGEEQADADALWQAMEDDTMDEWIAENQEWIKETG
ncbi:LCP family protein [Glycomyces buryatensis]|uniref:LytR family transcriptional regulator n=1 Tax=Glycomyces buryatensis TaxID=2570927 RepID=A0A4V4HS36_9ACTN|nr:LCP family protein [Glycomyces buryatensis]THV40086.1 LytR family transcriptional regulator [Glycomyces buryatensis]